MKRTFVIGDIHGCYDELMELTKKINLHADDLLISVGDIVDRGNKSKEVYEYLKNRPNTITLIGNHERKHINGILNYAQEIVKLQFGDEYQAFSDWLKTLIYIYETEESIIVHAAFEHDKSVEDQKEDVLSGSTAGERYLEKKHQPNTYWYNYYQGKKAIIYGHHVVGDQPQVINNTFGLDTGACHGGYLTALELPSFKIYQIKAKDDYWKSEQLKWQIPVLKSKDWVSMDFLNIEKKLEKLAYIEQSEVKDFLKNISVWLQNLYKVRISLKESLIAFTAKLLEEYKDNFTLEANKYFFKTFLFKSKNNNLKLEDLEKTLNTPSKVIELAKALELRNIQENYS